MAIANSKKMQCWLPTEKVRCKNESILILFERVIWNVAHSCGESKFSHDVLGFPKKCLDYLILWRLALYLSGMCSSIINYLFSILFTIICGWRRGNSHIRRLYNVYLLLTVNFFSDRRASWPSIVGVWCKCGLCLLITVRFIIAFPRLRFGDLWRERCGGRERSPTFFESG